MTINREEKLKRHLGVAEPNRYWQKLNSWCYTRRSLVVFHTYELGLSAAEVARLSWVPQVLRNSDEFCYPKIKLQQTTSEAVSYSGQLSLTLSFAILQSQKALS